MKKIFPIVLISLLVAVAVFGAGCTSSNNSTSGSSNTLSLAGSTSVQPDAQALAAAYMTNNSGVTVNVVGGGTAAGITAAGTGTAQIGMASANLTASELAQYPNLQSIPICVDGIAIIVNPHNTAVNGLTINQVMNIYTGNITNWNQVGGSNAKIDVVNREQGSGTRSGIQSLVLKNGNFSTGGITESSTGSVKSYVAGDTNAIGYIATNAVDSSVKALTINGIAPTYGNLANGTYVIERYLLYVTNGPATGLAQSFINYTLSPAGQAILKSQGEVALSDVPGYVPPTTTATAATATTATATSATTM
ncbi:MAG: phosphate ABC transporter substrate-binding protein [Halobacteriota archaeon]